MGGVPEYVVPLSAFLLWVVRSRVHNVECTSICILWVLIDMEPPLHIKKHSSSAFWYGGAAPYQKALNKCGYQSTLHYEPPITNKQKDSQQNNILWYNPQFSKNVSTNIRHRFLTIKDKYFRKDHKLKRIFNLTQSKSATAAWITLNRPSTTTTNAF